MMQHYSCPAKRTGHRMTAFKEEGAVSTTGAILAFRFLAQCRQFGFQVIQPVGAFFNAFPVRPSVENSQYILHAGNHRAFPFVVKSTKLSKEAG